MKLGFLKHCLQAKAAWRLENIFSVNLAFNLLKPTGYVMHQQFNIQQLLALPTLYLCVLYLSENKQRLVPLTSKTDWFL
jgi:hypothetical protein